MHDVAAKYRVVLAPAGREGDMAGRMSRRRQNAQMIADRKIVAHDVRPPGFDHRQDAVAERRHLGLGVLLGPVVIFGPSAASSYFETAASHALVVETAGVNSPPDY